MPQVTSQMLGREVTLETHYRSCILYFLPPPTWNGTNVVGFLAHFLPGLIGVHPSSYTTASNCFRTCNLELLDTLEMGEKRRRLNTS